MHPHCGTALSSSCTPHNDVARNDCCSQRPLAFARASVPPATVGGHAEHLPDEHATTAAAAAVVGPRPSSPRAHQTLLGVDFSAAVRRMPRYGTTQRARSVCASINTCCHKVCCGLWKHAQSSSVSRVHACIRVTAINAMGR